MLGYVRGAGLMTSAAATLVCFAVEQEAAHFRHLARGAAGVEILITGMGRRNAEQALSAVLGRRCPQRLITAGFAGALVPDLGRGTVVFFGGQDPPLETRLLGLAARRVRFHCAERVASTAAEKRLLQSSTG